MALLANIRLDGKGLLASDKHTSLCILESIEVEEESFKHEHGSHFLKDKQ